MSWTSIWTPSASYPGPNDISYLWKSEKRTSPIGELGWRLGVPGVDPGRWDVDRVRCSDLLGAADDDRAAAAMFYYGYLAAKAGIHVIDVRQIDGNVRKVMDRCAAAPNITVPQAFRQALGRRG